MVAYTGNRETSGKLIAAKKELSFQTGERVKRALSKVDGIEALKNTRSDNRANKIPIVMLISPKEPLDIQKYYELGVNSYVVKPEAIDEFKKILSELGLSWMIVNQLPQ